MADYSYDYIQSINEEQQIMRSENAQRFDQLSAREDNMIAGRQMFEENLMREKAEEVGKDMRRMVARNMERQSMYERRQAEDGRRNFELADERGRAVMNQKSREFENQRMYALERRNREDRLYHREKEIDLEREDRAERMKDRQIERTRAIEGFKDQCNTAANTYSRMNQACMDRIEARRSLVDKRLELQEARNNAPSYSVNSRTITRTIIPTKTFYYYS